MRMPFRLPKARRSVEAPAPIAGSDPPQTPMAAEPKPAAAKQRRVRIGRDIRGEPVVAWRAADGRFMCAWIDQAGDGSKSKALFIAETETLGGRIKGVEAVESVLRSGNDLDALIACATERGAFRE